VSSNIITEILWHAHCQYDAFKLGEKKDSRCSRRGCTPRMRSTRQVKNTRRESFSLIFSAKYLCSDTKKQFFVRRKSHSLNNIFVSYYISHHESWKRISLSRWVPKHFPFCVWSHEQSGVRAGALAHSHTKISIFVFCVLMNDGARGPLGAYCGSTLLGVQRKICAKQRVCGAKFVWARRRLCFISGLLQQWSVAVMKYLPKEILHEAHSLITLGWSSAHQH